MSVKRQLRNGFDKLAAPYRWMEYLSFGPTLWRTRTAWLPRMLDARSVLVLGDGDGRFTAALLGANTNAEVEAVDASAGMLAALRKRVEAHGNGGRLRITCMDALRHKPKSQVDLICTHFFLDCFREADVRTLALRYAPVLRPGGSWVVSEFALPEGRARPFAMVLVRLLYLVFGALTGLRVTQLPAYASALEEAGLRCTDVQTRLCGILRAELWTKEAATADCSHTASNRV